jgi:hypothetical protein
MGRSRLLLCVTVVVALTMSKAARADDVRTLEKQLADEVSSLSTSDCNLACRALASIRRAADRICALEPGPRCDAARAKVAEAVRRVQESCPSCAAVDIPLAEEASAREEKESRAETPTQLTAGQTVRRGGCRACMTAPAPNRTDFAWLAFAGWGAFCLRRRGPKKDRRPL